MKVLLAVTCVAILVVCAAYMDEHVTCFNLLGVTKGCITK